MLSHRAILHFFLGTICIQAFFGAYFKFAPWEDLNADLENWLEDKAYTPIISEPDPPRADLEVSPPKKKTKTQIVQHTVKKGENLSKIWNKYAGNLDRFPEAKAAFEKVGLKFNSLKTGECLELALRKEGDIQRIKKTLDDGRVVILKKSDLTGYQARMKAPRIKNQHKVVTATIFDSFVRSARDASVPYEVVDEFVDLFGDKIDFSKDLQPGDTFSVVYDEKKVHGKDKILDIVVQAASLKLSDKLYAVVRHVGQDGKARYYDEKGRLLGNFFLRYPVQFTRITSVFSNSRMHPILKVRTAHPGVDFAAPIGTPVRSVADGIITQAAFRGGAGNMIEIKHGGNVRTVYMHLSRYAKGIRVGSAVKRGQLIGHVGSSGLSTGPHLDYRLSIAGKFVNPLSSKLPQVLNQKDAIPSKLLQATIQTLNLRHENMTLALRELGVLKDKA